MSILVGLLASRNALSLIRFNSLNCRNLSTSNLRNGLSDPFKPKNSKLDAELKKLLKTSDRESFPIQTDRDNILARFVKKVFKPTPLNERFSKQFNIDKNYRIIYINKDESSYLLICYLTYSIIPLWLIIVVFFLSQQVGEDSENLDADKKVENPLLITALISLWFFIVYYAAKRTISTFILRIYYNQAEEKFKFIKLDKWFGFESEEFTRKNVNYIFPKRDGNLFINNLTKNYCNVNINNKLWRIELFNFKSINYVEKMLGERAANEASIERSKFNL